MSFGRQLVELDVPRKAESPERGNAPPVHVDFIPRKSVLRGHRNGVMVVVPAFTEGEDCDPETVRGSVGCKEAARAPHVRRGINQPWGGQSETVPKEHG